MAEFSLVSECATGGCGAKIGPGELSGLLSGLPRSKDPNLVVGYDSSDDAAVYDIGQSYVISTADFFQPMVDDPYTFGKIAAANALSDVYAMGGRPVMALNLVCFPQKTSLDILAEILRGGAEKIQESGASLAGGHSIYDSSIKYGLSVTGVCDKNALHKNSLLRNNSPKPGDKLILTKALGTGLILAASRAGEAEASHLEGAAKSMEQLNKYAAEAMAGLHISACTDITGFGLACHGIEMAGDEATLVIDKGEVPALPGALKYADEFLLTAAGQRNRLFAGNKVSVDGLDASMQELVFDPQTSGGLLIAVQEDEVLELLARLKTSCPFASIIGTVIKREGAAIRFN